MSPSSNVTKADGMKSLLSGAVIYLTKEQAQRLRQSFPGGLMVRAEVWAIPAFHRDYGGSCFKVEVLCPDHPRNCAISPTNPEIAFSWSSLFGSGFIFLGELGEVIARSVS